MQDMPYIDYDIENAEELEEASNEVVAEVPKEDTAEVPAIDILEEVKEFIHENPEDIDLIGIREKFGFTCEQVAEGIGITYNYYRKVERKWASLTDRVASKISDFYGFEIKPYALKPQVKEKIIKKNEEKTSYTSVKPVKDSPERRLHLTLKKKHSELANKIVQRYEAINTIKEMINDIFLKDGD